jgi:transcriptional regulator with XRE-family HTH domain
MAKDIRFQLAQRLKELRKHHSLTQDGYADRAGISTKYLQNLEGKNPKKATIVTLQKLAKGFDIPVWKLLLFKD